jgi:hypothetical protein
MALHKPITTQPSKSYYISRGLVNHISTTKHVVKVLHKPISRPFSQQEQRVADVSLKMCSNDYLFNKKKENFFHTKFIFRVDHRDGSSRVRVEGWELEWWDLDMLLKKDVRQSANHATSNTPWVSGWPDLLHKHNINKTQCNFVNNAQIAVIFVPFNLDSQVT